MQSKKNSNSPIQDLLPLYIDRVREIIKSYHISEKKDLEIFHQLSHPCQIEIFRIDTYPEFQIFYITHEQNRRDKECIVHRLLRPNEITSFLTEILSNGHWKQTFLTKNAKSNENYEIQSGKEFAEMIIIPYLTIIINSLFVPSINFNFIENRTFGQNGYVALHQGNYFQGGLTSLIQSIRKKLASGNSTPKILSNQEINLEKDHIISDVHEYGTILYPNAYIGKKNDLSIQELLTQNYELKKYPISIDSYNLEIDSEGKIFVKTSNRLKANEILNLFIIAAREYDYFFLTTRQTELIEDNKIMRVSASNSARTYLSNNHSKDKFSDYMISEKILQDITNKANELSHSVSSPILLILAEALTYFWTNDFIQCFLTAWIGIEKFCFVLLRQMNGQTSVDLDKIYNVIEYFRENRIFSPEIIENLHLIRKIRNKYVHENFDLGKNDAKDALTSFQSIVMNKNLLSKDWVNQIIPIADLSVDFNGFKIMNLD